MTTLREVFGVSQDALQLNSKESWTIVKEKLDKELKEIKRFKFLPDLIKKTGELLNIEVPDLLIISWKKAKEIHDVLSESEQMPEKIIEVELAGHNIDCDLNPYIEIRVNGIPHPKRINFKIGMSFDLKGIILIIQKGDIREIQTGSCIITGSLECEGILLAEKKSEEIKLPGRLLIST